MSPAIPVWIVPDAELLRNGGDTPIEGGPAVPLANPPVSLLISSESNNQLEEGSDGKLYVPQGGGGGGYPTVTVAGDWSAALTAWNQVRLAIGLPNPTSEVSEGMVIEVWLYTANGDGAVIQAKAENGEGTFYLYQAQYTLHSEMAAAWATTPAPGATVFITTVFVHHYVVV